MTQAKSTGPLLERHTLKTFANTSSVFRRRDASYIQQIEGYTTEVRNCQPFLKVAVVCPWYKLLSNAGGLWSVFLPLSAQKLMNEIVEESQRLAKGVILKWRLQTTEPVEPPEPVEPIFFCQKSNKIKT